jgi:hypothetical protein
MAEDLPQDVKQFIAQHIESLAQLEVLLYLRENAKRPVHPGEIASRLGFVSEMASAILADLTRQDFAVKADASFRFHPGSEEARGLIETVAEMYRTRRLAVTTEIYSRPLEKVRTLAEAFRLRKEQ